jgi:hypothetical protein
MHCDILLGNFALLAYPQPHWQVIVPQRLLTNMWRLGAFDRQMQQRLNA